MDAKIEARISGFVGITLALITIGWPNMPPLIIYICRIFAVFCLLISLYLMIPKKYIIKIIAPIRRLNRMWLIGGMVVGGAIFFYCAVAYFGNLSTESKPKQPTAKEIASEVVKKLPTETQRAWITLEAVNIIEPLRITEGEAYIGVYVVIKNYGNAPGTNIRIIPEMAAVPIKDGLDFEVAIKKALQVSKNWEKFRHRVGQTLAPRNILAQHHGLGLPRAEIISAVQAGKNRSRVIICLAGSIDYSFQGGTGQTTFNFVLTEKGTGSMGIEISPRVVPIENLVLQQELSGIGVYAK
jgi:hypothetical protein